MRKLTNEEYTTIIGEGNYMTRVSLPYSYLIHENNSNIIISTGDFHYSLEGKALPKETGVKGDYVCFGEVAVPISLEETLSIYLAEHILPNYEEVSVEDEPEVEVEPEPEVEDEPEVEVVPEVEVEAVKPISIEDISDIKRFEIDGSGTLNYVISEDRTRIIIKVTQKEGFGIHMGMIEDIESVGDDVITYIGENVIYKGKHGVHVDAHLFTFSSLRRIARNNYKGEIR